MPYIGSLARQVVDYMLDPLIEELQLMTDNGKVNTGIVVYVVYKIVKRLYGDGRFEKRSNAVKVLENAKLEYYRRVMAPYEEQKRRERGDVE